MDIGSLDRFVEAQEKMHPIAMEEIKHGKKRSHWMWFMFPQLRGFGMSPTAHIYGTSVAISGVIPRQADILTNKRAHVTINFEAGSVSIRAGYFTEF